MRKRENNWDFDFMLSHDCMLMNKCSYILTNNARFYLPNVKLGIVADRVIGCFWPSFLVANILLLLWWRPQNFNKNELMQHENAMFMGSTIHLFNLMYCCCLKLRINMNYVNISEPLIGVYYMFPKLNEFASIHKTIYTMSLVSSISKFIFE